MSRPSGTGAHDGWPTAPPDDMASTGEDPREVDVEVLVDDSWWPGYLRARDWHKTPQGRWACFVRFNTWLSPEGPIQDEARTFDEDQIRRGFRGESRRDQPSPGTN